MEKSKVQSKRSTPKIQYKSGKEDKRNQYAAARDYKDPLPDETFRKCMATAMAPPGLHPETQSTFIALSLAKEEGERAGGGERE